MNQNSNPVGNPRVTEPRIAQQDDPVRIEESEFGRFEDLVGKLVRVPKEEADAQRARTA
jgi:hypothetical protein